MEFFRIIIETGDQYQVSNKVDDKDTSTIKVSNKILFIVYASKVIKNWKNIIYSFKRVNTTENVFPNLISLSIACSSR